MVHPEVVLQGDCCVCLGGSLNLHVLLCLDGLVQPVRVAASFKDTAGLFVDYLHLVVHEHVLHILLEEGIGLHQLGHRVNALRLNCEILQQFILGAHPLLLILYTLLDVSNLASDVRKHEEAGILN